MKKIYSTILLVALALFSFSIGAQVSEDETGEFLTKEGYLIGIDDKVNPPCCNGETPDLSFNFSTGTGLSNHDIIELAREQALNAWFDRQYNLMKNEIGNRFNKPYPNFEQARNDYFKNWEKPNILNNASWVKSKYDSRVSAGLGDREGFVRNLKLLELRESELNLGNINNTSYGSFNFNGVPIGNITSLSQLNALRNYEIQTFSYNEVSIYHNSGVSQFMLIDIINDMGSYSNRFNFDYGILNELLALQINHYNTIGNGLPYHYTWYQLDLMQMYLNNIRNFGPTIPPVVAPTDFGTRSFLETYANQHRRGTVSIWDNGYYDYLVQGMLHPNETDERAIEAAEYAAELAVEAERQYALDNLLSNVSEDDIRILNNLTGKAKCVYNKLISSSEGFKNAIQKFDGEFPVAHLKLIMDDLGAARGETRAPDGNGTSPDFVITIAINNNSTINGVNFRPNLLTAKTIVHEVIHAEMFRKLLSLAKQGNLNFTNWTAQQQTDYIISIKNNFPGIFDYYTRYNWNTSTPNNAQHQAMATHYRNILARILQEFDTGIAVSNSQQPNQQYLDLAWEGLRYPNNHTWTSLSQTEKNRINSVISDYINDNKNDSCTE